MGKRIKSEKKGGGKESKFIEEYTPLLKGALQSDLRMCTKEPTFYDTNSLTMFWVLAKPDCCFLIIYYTLEA
jgi:hypothetical protein